MLKALDKRAKCGYIMFLVSSSTSVHSLKRYVRKRRSCRQLVVDHFSEDWYDLEE